MKSRMKISFFGGFHLLETHACTAQVVTRLFTLQKKGTEIKKKNAFWQFWSKEKV